MCTKNIYKKFCLMLILMGLILCNGKCVYAHSDELIKAVEESSKNPTIESLERLVCLFEEDVKYHQSRGETMEEYKSKAMALSIKSRIAIESYLNPTEKECKEIIDLLQSEIELWKEMEDYESLKDSLINMKQYEIRLCSLRVDNALLRAKENPTPENWKTVSQLSKEESLLYCAIGDIKLAKYCLAQSIHFKAIKYLHKAEKNSTIENWTKAAKFFNEATRIYYKLGVKTVAKEGSLII